MVPAKSHLLGASDELSHSFNGSVLFVKGRVINYFQLNLLDNREDIGFAIVVPVCANTQIHFLRVLVILEVDSEGEDGVGRGLLHVGEVVGAEL